MKPSIPQTLKTHTLTTMPLTFQLAIVHSYVENAIKLYEKLRLNNLTAKIGS